MRERGRPASARTWRPENELWDDLRGSFVLPREDCFDPPDQWSEQAEGFDPDWRPRPPEMRR